MNSNFFWHSISSVTVWWDEPSDSCITMSLLSGSKGYYFVLEDIHWWSLDIMLIHGQCGEIFLAYMFFVVFLEIHVKFFSKVCGLQVCPRCSSGSALLWTSKIFDVMQSASEPWKRTYTLLQCHSKSAVSLGVNCFCYVIVFGHTNIRHVIVPLALVVEYILKSCDFNRNSVKDWPRKWLSTTSVLMISFAKASFHLWAQQVSNWKNARCGRQLTIWKHISSALYAVPTSLPNIPAFRSIKYNTS